MMPVVATHMKIPYRRGRNQAGELDRSSFWRFAFAPGMFASVVVFFQFSYQHNRLSSRVITTAQHYHQRLAEILRGVGWDGVAMSTDRAFTSVSWIRHLK